MAQQLTVSKPIKTYAAKAPARRAYVPRPTDPGQRVSWTRTVGYATNQTRTGTIWSAGALPSSVWVQPDDSPSGDMALVMLRSMTEHASYPATWQHDTIRRCEHLRQSKGMFAEYRTELARSWGYGPAREEEHVVAFHCDRDCIEVRHETRDCTDWEPSTGYVIRMLLDASARGRSDLCRRCVYLTEPGLTVSGAA
jgi:hypothetical protein